MSDRLSEKDVTTLVQDVTTDPPFLERDVEYASRRELLYQQRAITLPGVNIKTKFHDPAIEDNAHQFKNRILAAPFSCRVAARSQSPRSVEKAANWEAFFYRYFYHWSALQVFDPQIFDMASLSIGWGFLTLNWELIPDLPEMKKDEDGEAYLDRVRPIIEKFTEDEQIDLFEYQSVRANTMYWTPGEDCRIHKSLVPYTKLANEYAKKGVGLNINGDNEITITTISPGVNTRNLGGQTKWSHTVELFIVSDDDYLYQCVNAGEKEGIKLLGAYPNIFGTPQFFPFKAEVTGDPHPLYATRSLVNPLFQTTPYRNLAINAKLTAGLDTAIQRYALEKIDPSVPDTENNALEIRVQNNVLVAPDGYRIINPGIATGPDLRDAIELINSEHMKYGMPKSIGKPDEVTASSGYERAQMTETVSNLMDPPLDHWAAMWAFGVFPAMAQGVKGLGIDLTVRNVRSEVAGGSPKNLQESVTIRPDDFMDMDINVNFSSKTLFSRIAEMEENLKLMAADMQHETGMLEDVIGVRDIAAWRKQRSADKGRKFADELAQTDAQSAITALRAQFQQQALDQAKVPPMVQNSDALRPDRGGSIPSGPGDAMPIAPTPAGQGGLSGPMPGPPGPPLVAGAPASGIPTAPGAPIPAGQVFR